MKLSLITICFNNVDYIQSTFDSVMKQDFLNLEYIVIDGGSTDGTLAIIQSYNKIITHCISEPDNGIYDAINKGIKQATGDWIGLLHAGDMLEGERVLTRIMDLTGNADFIYADLLYVRANDTNRVVRNWVSGSFSALKLKMGWMPPHPTVYVNRLLFEEFGLYDCSFRIAADYDWLLRVLKTSVRVVYLPELIVRMRMGGASNRDVGHVLRKSWEDIRAVRNNNVGGFYTVLFKNLRKIGQFLG